MVINKSGLINIKDVEFFPLEVISFNHSIPYQMTSVGGTDLSVALANRVRAQDATRAGSSDIPSVGNPGLDANPDYDIYGRPTGLQLTSGNRAGERTLRVMESVQLNNRPELGENTIMRPYTQTRDGLYSQTIYQAESQFNVLNAPATSLTPKSPEPESQTGRETFQ